MKVVTILNENFIFTKKSVGFTSIRFDLACDCATVLVCVWRDCRPYQSMVYVPNLKRQRVVIRMQLTIQLSLHNKCDINHCDTLLFKEQMFPESMSPFITSHRMFIFGAPFRMVLYILVHRSFYTCSGPFECVTLLWRANGANDCDDDDDNGDGTD